VRIVTNFLKVGPLYSPSLWGSLFGRRDRHSVTLCIIYVIPLLGVWSVTRTQCHFHPNIPSRLQASTRWHRVTQGCVVVLIIRGLVLERLAFAYCIVLYLCETRHALCLFQEQIRTKIYIESSSLFMSYCTSLIARLWNFLTNIHRKGTSLPKDNTAAYFNNSAFTSLKKVFTLLSM
jgi:hypothetical protein